MKIRTLVAELEVLTDGRTDGRTDGQTDRWTDRRDATAIGSVDLKGPCSLNCFEYCSMDTSYWGGQPRRLSCLRRSHVHSLKIARRSLCPEKLGSNPGQGSKEINFSGWHGLDMSITVTKRR